MIISKADCTDIGQRSGILTAGGSLLFVCRGSQEGVQRSRVPGSDEVEVAFIGPPREGHDPWHEDERYANYHHEARRSEAYPEAGRSRTPRSFSQGFIERNGRKLLINAEKNR
jgi:hypothetical protein